MLEKEGGRTGEEEGLTNKYTRARAQTGSNRPKRRRGKAHSGTVLGEKRGHIMQSRGEKISCLDE